MKAKFDKRNIKIDCLSNLSPLDKGRIINQFKFEKLYNAVQAAQFIVSISTTHVPVHKVVNTPRKNNIRSVHNLPSRALLGW